MNKAVFETAYQLIEQSRYLVAITGAGISAESGIPVFRSPDGLWSRYDSEIHAGIHGFQADPERSWRFFLTLFEILVGSRPNTAHVSLAEMEKIGKLKYTITQNIDGLHQAAGQQKVIEIHGNMRNLVCMRCKRKWNSKGMIFDTKDLPPVCECSGVLKPDAVLFGESIPPESYFSALEQIRSADVIMLAGTSGLVHPVNEFPEIAIRHGARIIEINPVKTVLTDVYETIHLSGPAGSVLQALCKRLAQSSDKQLEHD
jgi:NAD-dependent deacetylase